MEARAPLRYERLDFYERYREYFHGLEGDFLGFLMDIDFIFEILDEYGPIPWLRRAIIREIRKGARRVIGSSSGAIMNSVSKALTRL